MPELNPRFLLDALSIILIDILLAGDNAVVIAMAVRSLSPEQRRLGIGIGSAFAVVLRIGLTFFAAQLLQTQFLKLAGGLAILWIAVMLLADSGIGGEGGREAKTLWQAMWLIIVADITMSVDNILAVAAASKGHLGLLIFGLGLSIPFVVFTSHFLSTLMDKYPIIIYIGSAILGRVGRRDDLHRSMGHKDLRRAALGRDGGRNCVCHRRRGGGLVDGAATPREQNPGLRRLL